MCHEMNSIQFTSPKHSTKMQRDPINSKNAIENHLSIKKYTANKTRQNPLFSVYIRAIIPSENNVKHLKVINTHSFTKENDSESRFMRKPLKRGYKSKKSTQRL